MAARFLGAPIPPLFFDENDDFGEFEFVSAPHPPPPPPPAADFLDSFRFPAPLHPLAPVPNTDGGVGGLSAGGVDDGDEWGDFMENPLSFFTPTTVSPSPSHPQLFPEPPPVRSEVTAPKASKGWEKPTGAIPLSIFGEEEGDVEEPDLGGGSALPGAKDLFFPSAPKPSKVVPVGVGIHDLLADLYGQAETNKACNDGTDVEKVSNGTVEGGADDAVGHGDQDDDFDNGGWEFKAAVPDAGLADLMFEQQKDTGDLFLRPDSSTNGALLQNDIISGSSGEHVADCGSSYSNMNPTFINGHANSDEMKFEVKDHVLDSKVSQQNIDFFGLQDAGSTSNGKYQEMDDLWGNSMEELSTSNAGGRKQESSEDIRPASGSTGLNGVLSDNKTNFPDLLSSLYEETDKEMKMESPRNVNGSANAVTDSMNMDSQLLYDNDWYSQNAFLETSMQHETSLHTEDQSPQTESEIQKLLVSFYSNLKQVAYSVALDHLQNHKKAYELAVHSGEELKATELSREIQEASAKLQVRPEDIENAAIDISFEGISLGDLLENLKLPQFQTLDGEFSLSERIVLAGKEMDTATDLYEHALSTLYILQSASLDGQKKYIFAWSKMLLVCLQELQHGANIWKECVHANICPQIISEHRGCEFLFALGEIYRVSEILQLSLKVFKPWMLLSTTAECDLFDFSDRCSECWIVSGLDKALEDISERTNLKVNIKMVLESTKSIHNLSIQSLQNQLPVHGGPICRLSLLPLGMLPDMKDVVWDGKSYFLKLANLWANRVSCDPPKLPLLKIG